MVTNFSIQVPTEKTTSWLLSAGLLDARQTRLVHLAGGITVRQRVDYRKEGGPAGLIEMKGREHASLL